MDTEKHFFAVDLGATSGRTILGTLSGGKIKLDEVTRFPNNLIQTRGHFFWDIYALYNEVIRGLQTVAKQGVRIDSIGIDTWGVDVVCVGSDGHILRQPMAYRDPSTFSAMSDYLDHVMSRKEVYDVTGIQFLNFNTLFQFHAMRREDSEALAHADKILFVPDALSWMLTGNVVCEYTIASTSQMLDPMTGDLDLGLLHSVGLKRSQFGRMVSPGQPIGVLTEEVQKMTGLGAIPVIAVAGHDTASAVAAVPAADERFAYLSSGTWSLMGVETPKAIISQLSFERNFTNEGGIEGTTRFLKNICGMWLLERCRKEWGDEAPAEYPKIIEAAMQQPAFRSLINPDDPSFANPANMQEAIQEFCRRTCQPVPEGFAAIARCIFESLALRYRKVFSYLVEMAPFEISKLHIIGGGSRNDFLNQLTANSTGAEVLAGPQECTALGNVMLQAKTAGAVKDLWDMRRVIAASIDLKKFVPQDQEAWEKAYRKYLDIDNQ